MIEKLLNPMISKYRDEADVFDPSLFLLYPSYVSLFKSARKNFRIQSATFAPLPPLDIFPHKKHLFLRADPLNGGWKR